jgi:hypothetical protein
LTGIPCRSEDQRARSRTGTLVIANQTPSWSQRQCRHSRPVAHTSPLVVWPPIHVGCVRSCREFVAPRFGYREVLLRPADRPLSITTMSSSHPQPPTHWPSGWLSVHPLTSALAEALAFASAWVAPVAYTQSVPSPAITVMQALEVPTG